MRYAKKSGACLIMSWTTKRPALGCDPAFQVRTCLISWWAFPRAIKHYLAGCQFEAKDEDGVSHGNIRISDDGASYGFGPFFTAARGGRGGHFGCGV